MDDRTALARLLAEHARALSATRHTTDGPFVGALDDIDADRLAAALLGDERFGRVCGPGPRKGAEPLVNAAELLTTVRARYVDDARMSAAAARELIDNAIAILAEHDAAIRSPYSRGPLPPEQVLAALVTHRQCVSGET